LGLGLPITASLVATMQGTISVESRLGEGSKFSVRLPAVFTKSEDSISLPQSNPRTSSSKLLHDEVAMGRVTALVIDDSKVNRLLLRNYLKRLGIQTCSTNCLTRALKLYEERLPQLILADLHVGRQKSLGLVSSIRALPGGKQALIFIITADSHFCSENCPVEIDVAGILKKPIEFEELRTQLEPVLQSLERPKSSIDPDSPNAFDELRTELRGMLAERLPSEIVRLNDAFASQDFKAIQLIAHRLRGSAANAGWTELAEAAAKLEAQPTLLPEFNVRQS
jgi:CheY-like chemotaxis protein